jgi:hypothetical protein
MGLIYEKIGKAERTIREEMLVEQTEKFAHFFGIFL